MFQINELEYPHTYVENLKMTSLCLVFIIPRVFHTMINFTVLIMTLFLKLQFVLENLF